MVHVYHDKGVAVHIDPESCAIDRIICRLQTAGLDDNGENLIDWRSCKHLIDVYVEAEIAHGRAITRSAAMWIGLDETARRYIRVIIDLWLAQRKGDAIIAERK